MKKARDKEGTVGSMFPDAEFQTTAHTFNKARLVKGQSFGKQSDNFHRNIEKKHGAEINTQTHTHNKRGKKKSRVLE